MTYNRIIQGQTGRKRKEGRREKKRFFRSFLKKKRRRGGTISDGQGGGIFRWLLTECISRGHCWKQRPPDGRI